MTRTRGDSHPAALMGEERKLGQENSQVEKMSARLKSDNQCLLWMAIIRILFILISSVLYLLFFITTFFRSIMFLEQLQ